MSGQWEEWGDVCQGVYTFSYKMNKFWRPHVQCSDYSICIGEGEVAQSYPTLCDPMDYTFHGILQARILEWVAFLFSRESSQPRG